MAPIERFMEAPNRHALITASASVLVVLAACEDRVAEPMPPPQHTGSDEGAREELVVPMPETADAQVAGGEELYALHCSGCHGVGGGGGAGPHLIGHEALTAEPAPGAGGRDIHLPTVDALWDWTQEHMPADRPESLSDNEYGMILAYLLDANGILLPEEGLDHEVARELRLP